MRDDEAGVGVLKANEVSVLLVEDDSMVRSWVRLSLQGTEFRLAGEASTGAEAVELAHRRRPDLLLVDYHLGDGLGTEVLRRLRAEGVTAPAIVMTANTSAGFNEQARDVGAQGSVLKTGRVDDLLDALREVHQGRTAFDRNHPPRSARRGALSPREREVLRLVAAGATNRAIAAELGVSEETVKTLVGRTFTKLGARKRAEAVSEAHRLGLL